MTAFPIQVSFRNMAVSDAVETLCWQEAVRLHDACDRISNCRVVIEARPNGTPDTEFVSVRIDLNIPGQRVVSARSDQRIESAQIDATISETIHQAFTDAARRIRERLGL